MQKKPPTPEFISPVFERPYEFQRDFAEKQWVVLNVKCQGSTKLVPHLHNHLNDATHYHNLKYIDQLGLNITELDNTISLKQDKWLKQYIDFNIEKPTHSTEFKNDLFKLTNNPVFL